MPGTWKVTPRAVIGTGIQRQATECRSAEIVDAPAPTGSGVADLQRAAVQICLLPRNDTLTMQEWLATKGLTQTTTTTYGTCRVIATPGDVTRRLAYAQASDRRAEIATTITSPPSTAPQRAQEIAAILSTMRCPSS